MVQIFSHGARVVCLSALVDGANVSEKVTAREKPLPKRFLGPWESNDGVVQGCKAVVGFQKASRLEASL